MCEVFNPKHAETLSNSPSITKLTIKRNGIIPSPPNPKATI